jgi:Kef-type K+ transport system membrane component KefB
MASVHANEQLLFTILLQLIIMIGAARLMNALARRFGQPGAVGEIIAGLMLGPSLLGLVFPAASAALFGEAASAPIVVISQIGLILLMFQIGAEFEFAHLAHDRHRKAVIRVALASIVVPFAFGIGLGLSAASRLAPGADPVAFAMFMGVALAITAVPILGRILAEYRLTRTPIGVIAISAAAFNDVAGWILLAGIAAYAASTLTGALLTATFGGIAVFIVVWAVGGPRLAAWLVTRFPLRDGRIPPTLMAAVLALMFAAGIATYKLGVFTIFGGFAVGVLFHRHQAFASAWQRQVGQFVLVFFLPVFFTYTGLRTNLLGLGASDLGWLAAILAAATLGKIVPVYLAARSCAMMPAEAGVLGTLMNTRALMELIVLNIGYDLGVLPRNVFTMLVVMAVVTTVMTGPLLRLLLPRMGHDIRDRIDA